ncbi:hypothetical protein [Oceanospirillum maris]|uniref:hypothetical protein n=1 Tax=Oceanospirillum maris TaxID=64977 RepID=UPI0004161A7C|nr:hypothetical protein [Oceanospirillum maris]
MSGNNEDLLEHEGLEGQTDQEFTLGLGSVVVVLFVVGLSVLGIRSTVNWW